MVEIRKVVASASSKVLISGAYLIIDPQNQGMVVATSARMYCTITHDDTNPQITLQSPQFGLDTQYDCQSKSMLDKCVYFAQEFLGAGLSHCNIVFEGDNSFYSQRSSKYFPNLLHEQPRFDIPINTQHKTGMGSSAALIVSFLAAVKKFRGLNFEIHSASQLLNAFFQEKIGSGFDIATCVFGTQIYKRFTNISQLEQALATKSFDCFASTFDYTFKPLEINASMCLIDVGSGSDTRLMVKQVTQWSQANSQDGQIFNDVHFSSLKQLYSEMQEELQAYLPSGTAIRALCAKIRAEIQAITRESCVMIEPPVQTKLLDELLDCFTPEEVWYAGVPGAGGDDAIFAIGNPNIDLKKLIAQRFTAQRPWLAVLPVDIIREGCLQVE